LWPADYLECFPSIGESLGVVGLNRHGTIMDDEHLSPAIACHQGI
jgi:hypothetical protein